MKGDTEVLSETNEQKKDNVHVGYENNSNKVQPNSSTDLNLSGMNNSDFQSGTHWCSTRVLREKCLNTE